MPTCIYCKKDSDPKGVEHVYPEGLGKHGWTLPAGAVCDPCNGYLAQLDTAVIAHPHISTMLMLADVPGKAGPRSELGVIARVGPERRIHLHLDRWVEETRVTDASIFIRSRTAPQFRDDRFRRGLFKIAFNLAASTFGPTYMLHARYDRVRRYIRAPLKGEKWTYGQRILPDAPAMRLGFARASASLGPGYRLTLYVDDFFVDLTQPDEFVALIAREHPPGTILVHA